MQYRIISYHGHYRVQYRGWSTLGIWATHSWHGYGDSIPEEYYSLDDARWVLDNLKAKDACMAQPRRVVYMDERSEP